MPAQVMAIRLGNFMAFEDSGWIEFNSIGLLFGRNSTGKSAIMRALLLLRQSLQADNSYGALRVAAEDGTDVGTFADFVHLHDVRRTVEFSLRVFVDDERALLVSAEENGGEPVYGKYVKWGAKYGIVGSSVEVSLDYRPNERGDISLVRFKVTAVVDVTSSETGLEERRSLRVLDGSRAQGRSGEASWVFQSDVLPSVSAPGSIWIASDLFVSAGFMPQLRVRGSVDYGEEGFGPDFNFASWLLKLIKSDVEAFFRHIRYLGPIRDEPQRFYYIPQLSSAGVGTHGQDFVRAFLSAGDTREDIISRINNWLARASVNSRLEIEALDGRRSIFAVRLDEQLTEPQTALGDSQLSVNLRDVGFGASQVIPVIIESLLAEPNSLVLLEQPELHLHPRAQAELGDLFVAVAQTGARFLIETHSEHLLLRLRRWIAETSAWRAGARSGPTANDRRPLSISDSVFLASENLKVYFVDRINHTSAASEISVGSSGEFEGDIPLAYDDFFADDMLESIAIARARLTLNVRD